MWFLKYQQFVNNNGIFVDIHTFSFWCFIPIEKPDNISIIKNNESKIKCNIYLICLA